MKITYNSPFILTYTFICFIITLLDQTIFPNFKSFFTVYPFSQMSLSDPLTYFRLFSHAMGHGNWEHFIGNFSFILLIGPILEEKYGTRLLFITSFLTAFLTGILNASLFSSGLLGASGIVFMFILMVSFTNMRSGVIPLTFILITFLYLGREIYNALAVANNTSEFAHILGGISGGIFGYAYSSERHKKGVTAK